MIWAASRTDWEILRAEPFMPGTHPTSTCSSEEYGLLSNCVGQYAAGFCGSDWLPLRKFAPVGSISGISAGDFPASTREGRTFKMTRAHRLTVERKRHGTLLPLPEADRGPKESRANLRNTSGTRRHWGESLASLSVVLQVPAHTLAQALKAMQQLSVFLPQQLIGLSCPNFRSLTVEVVCHISCYLVLTICIGNLPPVAPQYPRSSLPTDLSAAQSKTNTVASAAWHQADGMLEE